MRPSHPSRGHVTKYGYCRVRVPGERRLQMPAAESQPDLVSERAPTDIAAETDA